MAEPNKITLTGAITIANPLWSMINQRMTFLLAQDGVGGRTVTWGSLFDTNLTWSDTGNTASKVASVSLVYDGARWRQLGAQVLWH